MKSRVKSTTKSSTSDSASAQAAKADREETVAAIREGLADVEAGRTKPARAALRSLAEKYGLTIPGK